MDDPEGPRSAGSERRCRMWNRKQIFYLLSEEEQPWHHHDLRAEEDSGYLRMPTPRP